MKRESRVGVHSKACVEALGVTAGLAALAEAGFSDIIFWAGEGGAHLRAAVECHRLGLTLRAVALPKACGLAGAPIALAGWLAAAAELAAPAAALMFSDDSRDTPTEAQWGRLCDWLTRQAEDLSLRLVIENNGRAAERFSSLREIARLLDRVPALSVALDTGHLACSGHAADDGAAALAPRMAWAEVHDNDGQHDLHLPLGQGVGAGSFRLALGALPVLPELLVIETDARLGGDRQAWIGSLRRDAQQLEGVLGNPSGGSL